MKKSQWSYFVNQHKNWALVLSVVIAVGMLAALPSQANCQVQEDEVISIRVLPNIINVGDEASWLDVSIHANIAYSRVDTESLLLTVFPEGNDPLDTDTYHCWADSLGRLVCKFSKTPLVNDLLDLCPDENCSYYADFTLTGNYKDTCEVCPADFFSGTEKDVLIINKPKRTLGPLDE